ncbi:MAG: precorrin-6y C5,15-methyltransferase (decarboxylating) subunit CbiE [Rhizobiaceae bacterium]|nr:precorrin-6y C5,15-methyltransferase (decarboxylating) subunit CbiE [Rhizobiaceae bacterium]
MSPWLTIIGIGEDGVDGLSKDALDEVSKAELIVGGDRHHTLAPNPTAQRIAWPSPFDAMIDEIKSHQGKRIVVLVTGDPLWYSVGARILNAVPKEEVRFFPQLSAFQWAACRMGWSLADVETVTVHGRAASQILPCLAPDVRMLVLTKDKTSPATIASLLVERGFGKSRLTVLAALGGEREERFDGTAETWLHDVPDFHTLAVECIGDENSKWYSRVGGLPDDAFVHDGQMTKRVVRSATVSALAPYQDALLWDVGAGCGSIAIEWMRAARGAKAIAIEPVVERVAMIRKNAIQLGTEKIEIVEGKAPEVLMGLDQPDAIFIGGGGTTDRVFEVCWDALRSGGRMVINAVTVESEMKLFEYHAEYGGELTRFSVQQAEPVGRFKGWKPFMPVTQWMVIKS